MRFAAWLCLIPALAGLPQQGTAQQFTAAGSDGVVITLKAGRLAVLVARGDSTVVDGVVAGDAPVQSAAPELLRGDIVVAIDGSRTSALGQIKSAWQALGVGRGVVLTVVRAGHAVDVRIEKREMPAGNSVMAIKSGTPGEGTAGAGAWVTAQPNEAASEVQIAGAHIRSNEQGMPEVVFRGSHPAATVVPLEVGDVITAVNGTSIAALAGLQLLYNKVAVSTPVTLTVQRKGRVETLRFAKPAPGQ